MKFCNIFFSIKIIIILEILIHVPISKSCPYCVLSPFFAAHFIDSSGYNKDAINDTISKQIYYLLNGNYFSGPARNIIAGASYDYIPFPSNVSTSEQALAAQNYILGAIQPYRGIFDLNTSVNTFLSQDKYSAFDPLTEIPAWAIIWSYSNLTDNQFNSINDAVSRLQLAGYIPLVVENSLTNSKMNQYMKQLPQSNILFPNLLRSDSFTLIDWIVSRVNMKYKVPIINQSGQSGQILSPNYRNNYPDHYIQEYYIAAPSDCYEILLTINDFKTEDIRDHLDVYKGSLMTHENQVYTWFGDMTPNSKYTIMSSAVSLRFITNGHLNYRGFNISWTAISVPSSS